MLTVLQDNCFMSLAPHFQKRLYTVQLDFHAQLGAGATFCPLKHLRDLWRPFSSACLTQKISRFLPIFKLFMSYQVLGLLNIFRNYASLLELSFLGLSWTFTTKRKGKQQSLWMTGPYQNVTGLSGMITVCCILNRNIFPAFPDPIYLTSPVCGWVSLNSMPIYDPTCVSNG